MDQAMEQLRRARIIAVAASKGGVGKTTLAFELAAHLRAWLVDLDWDSGGATRMWGYPGEARGSRLVDAFETGKEPRALRAPRRPALVPSHPDLALSVIPLDVVTDSLLSWATTIPHDWIVVDTHPGTNALTDGAMAAADLVVVPAVLGARELDALEGMLADFQAYSLLLVPNMVPPSPPKRWVERLGNLAAQAQVPVAPPISEYRWLRRRVRRSALALEERPGVSVERAAGEYRKVAEAVVAACG